VCLYACRLHYDTVPPEIVSDLSVLLNNIGIDLLSVTCIRIRFINFAAAQSGEGIVSLGVPLSRCRAVCVSAEPRLHVAVVSALKVMCSTQCSPFTSARGRSSFYLSASLCVCLSTRLFEKEFHEFFGGVERSPRNN